MTSPPEEEKRLKRQAKYRQNREKERAYQRAYYAANKERLQAASRANWAANRDRGRAYQKAWVRADRVRNPEYYLLENARKRARKFGREFDLTLADIVIPAICPVLGIPITVESGPVAPGTPSIDRIDNRGGYTRGNVRVISFRANVIKGDMIREEAEMLARNWDRR